jgi:hypothetical protein
MQLTSKDGNMVCDFYPASGLTDKFVQVTSFQGKEMSERMISKKEMEYEANGRINEYGYEVTKFHTQPRMKVMVCC